MNHPHPAIELNARPSSTFAAKLAETQALLSQAAADYAAQGQDQRDRQRELTTGARRENIRGKAINFKGAESDYEPTVAEMAGGAVRDKLRAGADGIDSAQQTASSWGSRISSFASRAWQGTKKLATRGLKAFTGLFGR